MTRLVPQIPLPPYAYLPGKNPHPTTDRRGHSFIRRESLTESLALRYGADLFNFHFYWEAHEQWEGIWKKYGRETSEAKMLQVLILLAAAGVKRALGQEHGMNVHLQRAHELFSSIAVLPQLEISVEKVAQQLANPFYSPLLF